MVSCLQWMPISFRPPEDMILTTDEVACAAYIFGPDLKWQVNRDEVLVSTHTAYANRESLATLVPGEQVIQDVIDSLTCILTQEHKKLNKLLSIWFLPTTFSAIFIERMLEHKSFYMSSEITVPRISEFCVVKPSDLPQQRKGSNDCGIWVAQWMKECGWTDDFGITVYDSDRMRLAIDLVKGRLEGGQLYTPAYVARMNAMVRGAARGITVPTNLTVLWSSLQQLLQEMGGTGGVAVDESFFQYLFNGLVKEGEIQGSVRAGVHWTPAVVLHRHLLRTVAAPMVDMLLHDLDEQNKLKNGVELQKALSSESISVSPGDRVAISKSFPRPLADKALAVVEALEGKDGISNFATNLIVKSENADPSSLKIPKTTNICMLHPPPSFMIDAEVLALSVAYDEHWFTNTRNFWVGPGSQVWPDQKIKLKLKALYMYAAGLYS
ncbi:hypothetical protein HN51_044822 [Arachis hypogaea]